MQGAPRDPPQPYRRQRQICIRDGTIYEAFLKAAYIEELAELYHHALTAGGGAEPDCFDQAELRKWEYPAQIGLPRG